VSILKASDVNIPPAPEWLRGFAAEKWAMIWPLLERSRINPEMHSDIVAMYCQAYSDFREACAYIGVKGAIVKDDSGKVFTNPYVPVRDAAVKQMVLIGSKLGLGPDDQSFQVSWDDYAPTARTYTDPLSA
jgi:P27 family predicted phage terminase small subunit